MKQEKPNVHPCGPIQVNAISFVWGGIFYVIDPGGALPRLKEDAAAFPDLEKVILLTHAHADHIAELPDVARELGIRKVFLHPEDVPLYESPANEIAPYICHPADLPSTQWPPELPGLEIRHTPGHSRGSVVYWFPECGTAFTGDTIFLESVGRTDLPGGSEEELANSIRTQIYTLPPDTVLIPGHGPATSVAYERENNPYVRPLGK